jgi:formyltetrahydrofolate hydrolase
VDLLHRQQAGELHCSIPPIVGNHPDAEPLARFYGVEFRHVPVSRDAKRHAEEEQLRLLSAANIINVHHSFLPAFQRGAKLIGATSHYVTAVLDDGPIIEQDVVRISHRDQVEDLIRKGRDVEKSVLSRAASGIRLVHQSSVPAARSLRPATSGLRACTRADKGAPQPPISFLSVFICVHLWPKKLLEVPSCPSTKT